MDYGPMLKTTLNETSRCLCVYVNISIKIKFLFQLLRPYLENTLL